MDDQTDALTRTGSRSHFETCLGVELHSTDAAPYRQSFLCCDIHHLIDHLNQYGHHGGDSAIIAVSNRLREFAYVIHRFGCDEFVLTGIKSPIPDIDSNLPVKIRQCVVDVDLPRSIKYSGRAKSWVIAHLQMAMVQPKMINETIYCCEPDAWGAA